MNSLIGFVIFLTLGCFLTLLARIRHRALNRYWSRGCTGRRWLRRFPGDSKTGIREFLTLFVDAFGFNRSRRCCFTPDDRIIDIYHAAIPPGLHDDMELEIFCLELEDRYGIDCSEIRDQKITLGELYYLVSIAPR